MSAVPQYAANLLVLAACAIMTCPDTPPRDMSQTQDEVKEKYDDLIGSEKNERMNNTRRSEEKEKHHGDSATVSSAASSMHEGHHENHDLEAITTVPTNSPPYSVFSKRQKIFIVCKLIPQSSCCTILTCYSPSCMGRFLFTS